MRKIEAPTLEEAYRLACEALDCSMGELKYQIVQYPSRGVFGIFAKPAVIVADRRVEVSAVATSAPMEEKAEEGSVTEPLVGHEQESVTAPEEAEEIQQHQEQGPQEDEQEEASSHREEKNSSHEAIIDNFFDESKETKSQTPSTVVANAESEQEMAREIEEQLVALLQASCFDMDVVEVDVIDDTAYIFIDGEDAALLIGKEGYRYNALSYLLFNWIHSRYQLYLKLEIAQFLSSQQEMIRHYLQSVIEHVEREGWGRTRPLDGILVQIALEQLREAFPDKYVAIKRQRDGGGRYVLVNEFNKRR